MTTSETAENKLFPLPTRAQAFWPMGFWLALGLPTLIYPFGRDQGLFAYIGQRLLAGERLYVDVWDVKSPLVYWFYAVIDALGGSSEIGLRVADMLLALGIAYLVYALTANIRKDGAGRTGAIAAIVYLLWYYLPNDFRVLSNSEVYFLPFALLGALLLSAALQQPEQTHWRKFFWAGVLLGVGPLVKTTAAGFLPAAALALWIQPKIPIKKKINLSLILGVGFALPLAFGGLYLMRTGALGEWWYLNSVYLPSYTSLAHSGGLIFTLKTAAHFGIDLTLIYPALTLGSLLFVIKFRELRNPGVEVTALFGLMYLGVVFAQGKFLHYHLLPLLPFFASIISVSALATLENFRSSALLRYMVMLIGALALNLVWQIPPRATELASVTFGGESAKRNYLKHLTRGNYPLDEISDVADYLRKHSFPGDKLFVWSFEPELYYFSGMPHVSKFLFNTPFFTGDIANEWKRELMAELYSTPPGHIVIGTNDGLPLIAGSNYSSAERLVEVPGLVDFIDERYEEVARRGRFIIYKRRTFAGQTTFDQFLTQTATAVEQ